MKIGLPKALLYHRYGVLWETFFEKLDCETVLSHDTTFDMMNEGAGVSVDECCLPVKVYLGHVKSLEGRCDRVFVPRHERLSKNEEFCPRFWGLPDIVRSTFPEILLLTCDHHGQRKVGGGHASLLTLGQQLGKSPAQTLNALRTALKAQKYAEKYDVFLQEQNIISDGIKVLLAAQPYILRDSYMGGPLLRNLREQGALPVFPDCCDRAACVKRSGELTEDLYWVLNREVIGAIPLMRNQVDGVVLVTAFPCGTDSLVNELVQRRMTGIPVTHIVLDEQQGEAGLQTRVECFVDILKERRRQHVS